MLDPASLFIIKILFPLHICCSNFLVLPICWQQAGKREGVYWNSQPHFTGGETGWERWIHPGKSGAEENVLIVDQRLYLSHKVHGLCTNNDNVHQALRT